MATDDWQATPRVWRYEGWIATAVYLGATLWLFHPGLSHLTTAIAGAPSDNAGYLWTLWYGHDALLGSRSLLGTDLVFHPTGTSLAYHVYSWANLLLALPLRPFLPLPAIYNLLLMSSFVLAGLGAHALIRLWVRDSWAALTGGLLFAFNPVHTAYALVQINTATIQFLPFFVFFFVRALRHGRWTDRARGALFFCLNALGSWYYLIHASLFLGLSAAYLGLRRDPRFPRTLLRETVFIAGGGLLPILPWLGFMAWTRFAHPIVAAATGHDVYVADLLGLFVPHHAHRLADWAPIAAANASYTGNPVGNTAYLGLVTLALAGAAFAWAPAPRRLLPFAFGALGFVVLAMGSHLHVAGIVTPVPLPTALLEHVPFLESARVPNRALVFSYLFLAILAAHGVAACLGRARTPRGRAWVLLVLGAAIVLDGPTAYRRFTSIDPPSVYDTIPRDGSAHALIDLPLTATNTAMYLAYQTHHGIPIAEGTVGRPLGPSLIDRLRDRSPDEAIELLRTHRIGWIVVHHAPPQLRRRSPELRALWLAAGLPIHFEDERATVFRVDPDRADADDAAQAVPTPVASVVRLPASRR